MVLGNETKRKYEDLNRLRNNERDRLLKLEHVLSEKDTELVDLQRHFEELESDLDRYKKEIARHSADLASLRSSNEEETLLRVELENKLQSLQEELNFQTQLHQTEIKELMDNLMRDTGDDYKRMFEKELMGAIKDIRQEYETILTITKPDTENWYKAKLQDMLEITTRKDKEESQAKEDAKRARDRLGQINEEILRLRNENTNLESRVNELERQVESEHRNYHSLLSQKDIELQDLQERIAAQLFELKELMDAKLRLDVEIAAYRRLLEGEENRLALTPQTQERARSYVSDRMKSEQSPISPGSSVKLISSESTSRTTFQRTSKGPIAISEVNPDGKFITFENTSRLKDQVMDGWKVKRRIDGRDDKVFFFPPRFVLKSGRTVKIWGRGAGGEHRPPNELVWSESSSWGTGLNVTTTIFNEKDEERASHIQKAA